MADIKPNLLSRDEAVRAGQQIALLDDLADSKPELVKFLIETILPQIKTTTGKGRKARAMREQQQQWDDFMVLEFVEYWREQGLIKSPPKVRDAIKTVREWRRSVCPVEEPPEVRAARKIVRQWEQRPREGRRKTPASVDAAREVVWKWLDWRQDYPPALHPTTEKIWQWYERGKPRPPTLEMVNAFDAMKKWREYGLGAGTSPPSAVRRALAVVKKWNEHGIKKARRRKFSDREIDKRVGKELNMSASKVRRARLRAEKRNREGYYVSELFIRSTLATENVTQSPAK